MAYIKHPKHVVFEYNKITDNIYIGTDQCCQVHFKSSLLKKGIRADISLEKEKLDHPEGVDYFLWIPVKDKQAPSSKQMLIGARAIKELIDNRFRVYVHCRRGHGRSPTLVAAYFILTGMTTYQATKKIKSRRKSAHFNKIQTAALKKFENKINSK